MINLNKFTLGSLLFVFFVTAHAGEAFLFDQPNLIAYSDGRKIYGLYDSENHTFSCYFLFKQIDDKLTRAKKSQGYLISNIFTFLPGDKSPAFGDRFKEYDINGKLYKDSRSWVIRTFRPQAGCANTLGVFEFDPPDNRAERYFITKKIPAIGLRIAASKTVFYDLRGEQFIPRKGYLMAGNGVIVLQSRDQFSFVRFVDPRTNVNSYGHVTTGWVRSADLIDPFPPRANHD